MSTPPAPARVFGYVAMEADVCVLLRRGPSKWVLMVRWNLATDEFEPGQWLKARVYEYSGDLSPDGRLFVYQANDGRYQQENGAVYSVVCRPPYFTALAFWAQGSTYFAGFRWVKRSAWGLLIDRPEAPTKGTLPSQYEKRLATYDFEKWMADHGWTAEGPKPKSYWKETTFGRLEWRLGSLVQGFGAFGEISRHTLGDEPLDADWADVDGRGRLLIARAGRIFVRDENGERELIDLNPLEFRPLEPPNWAKEWPS